MRQRGVAHVGLWCGIGATLFIIFFINTCLIAVIIIICIVILVFIRILIRIRIRILVGVTNTNTTAVTRCRSLVVSAVLSGVLRSHGAAEPDATHATVC